MIKYFTKQYDQPLFKRLMALALPIMAANLLQTLYNLADTFFLGKLGRVALSAPSISFNIIFFLIVFGMGFASAGTTLIAQSKGKQDQAKVDFYLGQITFLLFFCSILIGLTGFLLTRTLLVLLQVPEEAFHYTFQYMRIIFCGLPFMFLGFLLQSSLQGIGDSVTPLLVQLGTVTLNILLDPLFIFGLGRFPALGVAGAAIATVLSQIVASAISLTILIRGRRGIKLKRENLKPNLSAMKLIFSIGLPVSLGQGISALGFTVLQGIVNSFGTAVIAAFGIGNRIISMFNMPAQGLAQANAVLVGQSLGAKNKENAKKVVRIAIISMFLFISLGMTFTFFNGHLFVRIFVDDPEVISHGQSLFRMISPSVVFFALFTVITGAFQGGGDTKPIMVLNITRLWGIRVPFAYLLSYILSFGPKGIWMAMFLSNSVIALIGFYLLSRGRWMEKLNPDNI